jgi:hypothetical protein
MLNNFARDFAVSKLIPLLDMLIPTQRHSSIVDWYWRESRQWVAESQAEFDNVARLKLRGKFWQWDWFRPIPPAPDKIRTGPLEFGQVCPRFSWCKHFAGDPCQWCERDEKIAALAMEQIKQIGKSLRTGAAYRIPSQARERRFQVEDATQDGWVTILENGGVPVENVTNVQNPGDEVAKAANVIGQTAGHDVAETEQQYVSVSNTVEDGDGNEVEITLPWDATEPGDMYRRNPNEGLARFFADVADEIRERVLADFQQESPADYAFIMGYMLRRGKGTLTKREQNRAGSIADKLRRRLGKVRGKKYFSSKLARVGP